jgi:predicted transposase/invertase (TIGR01784 family)
VLGITIERVEIVENERAITPELGSKGIRMDVYVADGEGTVYDVEMQKVNPNNLEKRSRYYLSANDMDCIGEGVPYEGLRDSYVIFVCLFDPLGDDLPRYTVTPHCRETGTEVGDGATRVFVNATAHERCEDPRLAHLLAYLTGASMGDDEFCESVEREVRRVRDLPEWRAECMRFEIYVAERVAAAEKRGLERGMERGMEKGMEKGRELDARVAAALAEAGRADEIATALSDDDLFQQLLEEFGISDGREAES